MKWTAKQYVDLMTYNNPEKPMFSELFGPIVGLDKEWRAQGASEGQIALRDFCFDYVPYYNLGNLDSIHRPADKIIEDNTDYYIAIDHYGRRVKMAKATSTIPLPENYPVETMDDWLKIKHMFLWDESRVTDEMLEKAASLQQNGTLIKCEILGGFDILRELMGEVNCCIAFYEDPELIFEILKTISEMNVTALKKITRRIIPDQLSIHEDLAGKTAPMIGPATVREFLYRYYRDSWDVAQNAGVKLFCQDSDGNINVLIDDFIRCGVNIFYPCEPGGDMDIVALRKKYGKKIAFRGGIDKHVLRRTKEEIKSELDYKMQSCMTEGGVVFGLDHRIPNGTLLENYIYYVKYAREKLGLIPYENDEKGWGRMAF